jgi:hypothetical protein
MRDLIPVPEMTMRDLIPVPEMTMVSIDAEF